jgi:hypothetical protein
VTDLVEGLLQRRGPSLSSDLAKALVRKYHLTPAAARKRVSRRSGNVRQLAYIKFPRNARFVYLVKQFGSSSYWDNLIRALLDTNSAYGLALASLRLRNGIMPVSHFSAACGAPIRQKKHISADTIASRMIQAKLVGEYTVPGIGRCYGLLEGPDRYDEGQDLIRARLVAEDILLKATKSWSRRLGLVSYGRVATRGDAMRPPQVGTFAWDLSAPSYLAPLLGWVGKSPKPGFFACDVLLGSDVDEVGLKPFIHKCETLRTLSNVGRCLQVFVADHFSPKAFDLAKRTGVVPATPESLFGKDVAEGLSMLFDVLRDAAALGVSTEQVADLFQRLSQIEGAALNLRGALFEYVVAEIVRQTIGPNVRIRRIFRAPDGSKAEADVVVEKPNRAVTFIECKGHQPSGLIDDETARQWLVETIPTLYAAARQHSEWRNVDVKFEFWTSGRLSDTARNLILGKKREVRRTRYTLDLYEVDAVRNAARVTRDRALVRTLEENFLDHALSRKAKRPRRYVSRPYSAARKDPDPPPDEEFTKPD